MKKSDAYPLGSDALHRRAEKICRKEAARLPASPVDESSGETRRILHELRVHQLELEMQNEELRRTQEALDAARVRYLDLYNLAPVGYLILNEQGLMVEANHTAAKLLGVPPRGLARQPVTRFIFSEDQDRYYLHRKQLSKTGKPQTGELRMVKKDGSVFWGQLTATTARDADGTPACRIVLSDITEHKQVQLERAATVEFLRLINESPSTYTMVQAASGFLQQLSGCEAVGVRLREGDDYPYYETHGLPPEFICRENHLCAVDAQGNLIRDPQGQPFHECMCGHIINGRFDAGKPYFTAGGSFWTNSTTALLAAITDADQIIPTRNSCNVAGYESVALLPLRVGEERLGLVHFVDHRQGLFTRETIAGWERLLNYLAIAVSKTRAEENMRQSQARYQILSEATFEGIIISRNGLIVDTNNQLHQMLGYSRDELLGREIATILPAADSPKVLPEIMAGTEHASEHQMLRKDGTTITVETHGKSLGTGDCQNRITVLRDVTTRKRAETILRDNESRYRAIVEGFDGMIYICSQDYRVKFANAKLIERTGHDPVGELCYQTLHNRDSACPWCVNEKVLQGETVRWELKSPRDNRWYYVVNTPIRYTDGTIAKQAMIQDITERKEMADALLESRNQLELRVRERSAQLRELVSELTMAEHRERRRLAELLHDHLQQLLVGARLSLTRLKKSPDITFHQAAMTVDDLISQALTFSRSMTAELCPPILQNDGLMAALEWLARWMQKKYGLTVRLDAEPDSVPKTEGLNVLLFQAVRELLFNVVKHAGVKAAGVRVKRTAGTLEITVLDKGAGFDEGQARVHDGGFGLFSIRERLVLIGGSMAITSAPRQGCSITLRVPVGGTDVSENHATMTPGHVVSLISGMGSGAGQKLRRTKTAAASDKQPSGKRGRQP